MRRLAGLCILVAVGGSVIFSQEETVPARWVGTWALSLQESDLGQYWVPGAPKGMTVMSQSMQIAATSERIRITTNTLTSERGSSKEEFELSLDGRETVSPAGARLSFKRIDGRTFDIVVSANDNKLGSGVVEKHFVFSGSNRLIATEARTGLDGAAGSGNQTKDPVVRTSTSVLVFYRMLLIPHVSGPWHFKDIQ